jgi:hypothetical protein
MGTHQDEPLRGALFVLDHFKVSHSITNHFSFYLFPSIVKDIHIIGSLSIISFSYEHLQIKLCVICLFVQPHNV